MKFLYEFCLVGVSIQLCHVNSPVYTSAIIDIEGFMGVVSMSLHSYAIDCETILVL